MKFLTQHFQAINENIFKLGAVSGDSQPELSSQSRISEFERDVKLNLDSGLIDLAFRKHK
jgi:hypothetical protein